MNTISKDTFDFLTDIRENNNRDWFAKNKPRYVLAQENTKAFAAHLAELMAAHDNIEPPKVYRIYRDVRFSKNKTPYKSNMGIGFTRATDLLRGGIFLNIEPGNSFAGGGFWAPNGPDLKRIRNEFAVNAQEFRDILASEEFVQYFGTLQGDTLKTAPRGFAKDHPDVDLLRMKQFLVSKEFTDKKVTSKGFAMQANETFKAMRPFFNFMSDVLTTNENGESIF